MNRTVEHFFRMIRGAYGAGKFTQQFPTELDLQAAQILWENEIVKHSPEELKSAIDHAIHMSTSGESEWQWPNIGLILSGTRRYLTTAHRDFLPEPERELPTKEEIKNNINKLWEAFEK